VTLSLDIIRTALARVILDDVTKTWSRRV